LVAALCHRARGKWIAHRQALRPLAVCGATLRDPQQTM
jgi:hypothetical protein